MFHYIYINIAVYNYNDVYIYGKNIEKFDIITLLQTLNCIIIILYYFVTSRVPLYALII